MKLEFYNEKMASTFRVSLPKERLTADSADSYFPKDQKLSTDRIVLSADGLRKSRDAKTQSSTEAEAKLPPHIQQIKRRILQLKEMIAEQKQKLVELQQQSNMPEEVKEATLKLYQEQLSGLQLEKVAMM